MALFLTAETGCFGLAAGLLLLSCVCGYVKRSGRDLRPAFLAGGFLLGGCLLGFLRMEWEEWTFSRAETFFEESREAGSDLWACGMVMEIAESGSGYRVLLERVQVGTAEDLALAGEASGGQAGIAAEAPETLAGGSEPQPLGAGRHSPALAVSSISLRRIYCYVDSVPEMKIGRRVLMSGEGEAAEPARNPGGFDFRLYCRARGVSGLLYGDQSEVLTERYDVILESLRLFRSTLARRFEQIALPEDAGILQAVLLGDKAELDDAVYELYRRNGISHLLAISGLHVSMIGMGLWLGLRKCGFGYGGAGAIAGVWLLLYGGMVGFGPSVVRAVTMMLLSFLAGALGRTYDMPSAICIPAVFLLLQYPYVLTQAAFQLSFLAAFAVFFPGAALIRRFHGKGPVQALCVSLSIQLVTAPVILYHSFELPVYGVFLNLLVIPLMAYVVASGILGLLVSFFWEFGGAALLGGAHYILALYSWLCRLAEQLPLFSLNLGRPAGWQMVGFYGLLGVGAWIMDCGAGGDSGVKRGRRLADVGFLLWGIAFLLLFPVPRPGLTVTFLDVGQGDGILLEADGRRVLVDCGSSQKRSLGEDCLLPFLKSRAAGALDMVVVSHGDNDHISGIRYLLEQDDLSIAIGCLVMPKAGQGEEIYEKLEAAAREKGIAVHYAERGDTLGDVLNEAIQISCLYPAADTVCGNRNEESLVLLAEYGSFRLLLTGDVEAGGERTLLADGGLVPVTVLKAAHHGSTSSSGEEFVQAVRPAVVILSYGRGNSYGHPAPEVKGRFLDSGADVRETAVSGAIEVWTDGRKMKVSGFLD